MGSIIGELSTIVSLARREKLALVIAWLFVIMGAGSLVFFFAEQGVNEHVRSWWDAFYWAAISITTTGYGDIVPKTTAGRSAAALMVLAFMALMPLVGAIITSIYISRKLKGESGLEKVTASGHTLICGWNNNGHNILAGMQERRQSSTVVLVADIAADHFENLAQSYPRLKLAFVRGPYTNEATLSRANVRAAAVAIVLASYGLDSTLRSDEQTVLAILTLRGLAPELRIVAECFASGYVAHMRRAGANRVIVSGELDGFMLTAAALAPGLDMTVREALTFGQGNNMWIQPIPREFIGRRFIELAEHWLHEKCWILVGLVSHQKKLGIGEVLSGDKGSIDEFIVRSFESAGRGLGGIHHLHHLNPGREHIIRDDDLAILIYPPKD